MLFIVAGGTAWAGSASAENTFVTVGVTANNSVSIVDVGDDFYICTDDDYVEVTIAAKDDFDLVEPDPYTPPITINAGDSQDYAVEGIPPETMDGAGTIYVVKLDILSVPQYLFAAAKYWTPIKFKVLSDATSVTASSFTSLKATLHYKDASGTAQTKEISGLESYVAAVTGVNSFECYIDPANYVAISIANKHYSDNAYFTLEADLNLTEGAVTCTTDETDAEGNVASVFVDISIPAVDTLPGGSTAAEDLSCQSVAPGALRYKEISSPYPRTQINYTPGTLVTIVDILTNTDGVDSASGKAYWDKPHKPELTTTTSAMGLTSTVVSPLFRDAAITADVSAPTLSVKATMREPLSNDDKGLYQAEAVALRHGGYAYISYPGKDVTLSGRPIKAMDLSITTVNRVEVRGPLAQIDTELEVPTSGAGTDILKMTLNLGWALGPLLAVPPLGLTTTAALVSSAFGTSAILYDASYPDQAGHETGNSTARYALFRIDPSANVISRIERATLTSAALLDMGDRHNGVGGVFNAGGTGEFYSVSVGSCVGAFYEVSATVGLKAQDTYWTTFNPDPINETTVTAGGTIVVTDQLGKITPLH